MDFIVLFDKVYSLSTVICNKTLYLETDIKSIKIIFFFTAMKVTFYVENMTPVQTSCTVEAVNFYTTKTFDQLAHKFKFKKDGRSFTYFLKLN